MTILHASHNSAGSRIAYLGYSNSSEQVFHCDIAQGWRFDVNNSARMYIGRGGALNIEPVQTIQFHVAVVVFDGR